MVTASATPVLSTTPSTTNFRVDADNVTALVEAGQESPAYGLAEWLTAQDAEQVVYVSNESAGGQSYAQLAQGTTPSNNTIDNAEDAQTHALANGASGIRCVNVWWHGENDTQAGASAATYAGYMVDRQSDLQGDLRTRLGDAMLEMPLLMMQLNNWPQYGAGVTWYNAPPALGQFDAAEANPLIALVGPTYPFAENTADPSHVDNVSARRAGEYMAKAIQRWIVDGGPKWEPLHIETAEAVGNVVTLTYAGGDGSALVLDDTNVLARANNRGLAYTDGTASPAGIVSVALDGGNNRRLIVTLNKDAAADGVIESAWNAGWGADWGSGAAADGPAPATNIRDSDAAPSLNDAVPLYNWAITQRKDLDSFTAGGVTAPAWANTNSARSPASNGSHLVSPIWEACDAQTSCTWSWWFRRDTGWTVEQSMWDRTGALGGRQFGFRTYTSGRARFYIATDVNTLMNFTTATSLLSAATWYHFVVVFDGAQTGNARLLVYINDVDVTGAGAYSATPPAALTTPQGIAMSLFAPSNGGSTFNLNSNGRDFAVWPGLALSSANVTTLYNGGVPTDPSAASWGAPEHLYRCETDFCDYGVAAVPRHLTAIGGMTINGTNP